MNDQAVQTLSKHACEVIDTCTAKFPPEQKQSAVIAALTEVQHENGGFLTEALMDAVADYLDMPPIAVYEVASFYSMLETEPVGRHSISVCNNLTCMLCGGDEIIAYIENKLGVKIGESTSDGKFFFKLEEECLAACCGAPMMMVDHVYYENLTTDRVDKILGGLE